MRNNKKVLVCPLNWGLGHATRDVPVIKAFIEYGFKVFIATSGGAYSYLKEEFPQLELIHFPGYSVKYSKRNSQVINMFLLIPRILFWTIKEHRLLKNIVNKYNIDIVISDNRFGLWNKRVHNIFITHQLIVKFPGLLKVFEPFYQVISRFFIYKFNECWIPDFKNENNLSGELSHNVRLSNIHYINPISRFSLKEAGLQDRTIDVLFILSGPEPQRSLFEQIILQQASNSKLNLLMVRGVISKSECSIELPYINLANAEQMYDLITRSKLVVCRAGYSSVMDLFALQQKAVLVPTPGQTEQEYLANYLYRKDLFYTVSQKNFNLKKVIKGAIEFPKINVKYDNLLQDRILRLKK